ncbi:MAG: hypothetical protein H7X95_04765 [Deltaproteobacteria bacterium]|nr:hypothetical protein [Deltaproteobacteria bacterium]
MTPLVAAALAVFSFLVAPPDARAAEVTRVVSGFDDAGRFDFNVTLAWLHEQKQASIKRESAAAGTQSRLMNDLIYRQTRDVLLARVEMGIMRDVGLHVDLPYVLRDDRGLRFDQPNGAPCSPGGGGAGGLAGATCVNQDNSTILRDGVLPGAGQSTYGVDATAGGVPFAAPSSSVFRGPRRNGLEFLGVGVSWAVMNQARDDSKPTVLLGVDAKFDVGTTMRYDAAQPGANTAVGLGYHQFVASTFVSKRLGAMDPYFGGYFMLPVRSGGSPFADLPGGNQPHARPQNRAGVQFGFEFVPWERSEINQRVALEMRMRGDHRFQGSSHSELWEPLSGSSACGQGNVAACRPGVDLEFGGGAPHPGVTETQAYSTVGGDVGVSVRAGRYVRFRGVFGLAADLSHFITFATAGRDRDGDGQVDSTSAEANPAYREALDIPGRRFKVDGSQIWNLVVDAAVTF